MEPPIWKTPQFWRDRAAEWRGPQTQRTGSGICRQLEQCLPNTEWTESSQFLYTYEPENAKLFWFPRSDRASRAALCDRIADDLEKGATGL